MTGKVPKILLLLLILSVLSSFFLFDLGQYLSLSYFKGKQLAIESYYIDHRVSTIAVYMAIYILVAALSLPGATLITLVGGALFGLWVGVLIVSFASTIGATVAFFAARFLLRDYVQTKFGDNLKAINNGIEKDGVFYLLTLRLVPYFPYFVINLVMGLTPIKPGVFYLVSQVGMLAGTFVYVNAGTQIAKLDSLQGIMSPELLISFALLGIFPLIAKKIVAVIKNHKILRKYPRPAKFDYNLVVIGAGSAGLVSSLIAAMVKAKVALVEKHKMGGDCLNTGCVPSKALVRSAKILSYVKRAKDFGFRQGHVDYEFAEIMERVRKIVKTIEPHDSVERYTEMGVDCIQGQAMITSPYTVEVNGKTLKTRNIVLATGAGPFIPSIPGLEQVEYLTSDTIWDIRELPKRLVVLGGGPIGCELAQAFSRLGAEVALVEMFPKLLSREDDDVSEIILQKFKTEGISVLTGYQAKKIITDTHEKILICESDKDDVRVPFDQILIAVGRAANTKGFGLESIGVEISQKGTVQTNELLQTNFPNIYCAGDVAGPYQFTHTAAHQAWYASVNALFGNIKSFKVDYRVIPWATFTDPEVARVGLNEIEAKEKGIKYEVTVYGIDDLDRAIADSEANGMVKVLTKPGKDEILGVTIVGAHASDIIAEYVLAMKHKMGLNKIMETIHIYPTLSEANKYAAGQWKKTHKPDKLLMWVERYHAWRRS